MKGHTVFGYDYTKLNQVSPRVYEDLTDRLQVVDRESDNNNGVHGEKITYETGAVYVIKSGHWRGSDWKEIYVVESADEDDPEGAYMATFGK